MANDFGTLLYEAITDSGLTAAEFADRIGVTKGTVSKAINGRTPSLEMLASLEKWAQALRLTQFRAKELREAAHLARSTPEIRSLVTALRVQLSQMSDQIEQNRILTASLVKLMRSRGIEIPKDISDRL